MIKQKDPTFLTPRFPFEIDGFSEDSPSEKAGLKLGDRVISINGVPVPYFDQFSSIVKANKGKEIHAEVLRNADTLAFNIGDGLQLFLEKNYGLVSELFGGTDANM